MIKKCISSKAEKANVTNLLIKIREMKQRIPKRVNCCFSIILLFLFRTLHLLSSHCFYNKNFLFLTGKEHQIKTSIKPIFFISRLFWFILFTGQIFLLFPFSIVNNNEWGTKTKSLSTWTIKLFICDIILRVMLVFLMKNVFIFNMWLLDMGLY